MKTNIYILNYKNDYALNDMILKSLFDSDVDLTNVDVYILNNHPEINIQDDYLNKVKVITNHLRPTRSTAYIARDWNAAIIHGFEDLKNPKCKAVITIQNDTILKKNWYSLLLNYSKKYNFMSFGEGDAFIYHTPESVKRIGLFDERFSGIGYYEGDYFSRAYIYNHEKSSVNDFIHMRQFNVVDEQLLEDTSLKITGNEDLLQGKKNEKFSTLNRSLWYNKWDFLPYTDQYLPGLAKSKGPMLHSNFFYPWFELDIETIDEQVYYLDKCLTQDNDKYFVMFYRK